MLAGSRGLAGLTLAAALLAACGGGGGGGSDDGSGGDTLQPSGIYAQRCAPENALAAPNLRTGSLTVEKQWLRSYMDEAYLWRTEVPMIDASANAYSNSDVGASLEAYFYALLTPQRTASGADRDRFSFMMSTQAWNQLANGGVELSHGIVWTRLSDTPPRGLRVAQVAPGSPAALAGLQRGDTLVTVDGVSADASDSAGIDTLNAGLYPSVAGRNTQFMLRAADGSTRTVVLTSTALTLPPVPVSQVMNASDGTRVGYLVFNDHLASSEAPLTAAITALRDQGIGELVLDLRYNGGGYLFLASQLATMIAGTTRTSGRVFEQLQFNDRRQADTNSSSSRTPFRSTACLYDGSNCTSTQALPLLNLSRVYVLTQSSTCSASESVINGLRGVDVDVRLIGGATCGKPYGFTARDNCGYSYFPIEFVGSNAKGFGDYADGFVPGGSGSAGVPGCPVADDLDHALGDPAEAQLAAALQHRLSGACPARPGGTQRQALALGRWGGEGSAALADGRSPARSNRILLPQAR